MKFFSKSIVSLLLIMLLLVSSLPMFPVTVSASVTFEYEVINKSKKTCKITGPDDLYGEIVIPSKIKNYTVTEIDNYAFYGSDIYSVIIPDSVKSIGSSAFNDCGSLEKVQLSANLKTLGKECFSNCNKLTEIVFPKKLQTIGEAAFFSSGLSSSLIIPKSVTTIGETAFAFCYNLNEVTMPTDLETILFSTFSNCKNLKKVVLPKKLKKIGNFAFSATAFEGTFVIPGSVHSVGSNSFSNCDKLNTVIIEDGVKKINDYAFNDCDSLEYLVIPPSVTSFGEDIVERKSYAVIHGINGSPVSQKYRNNSVYTNHYIYDEFIVPPTCAKGYTNNICECGYESKSNYVKAIYEHTVEHTPLIVATNTTDGTDPGSFCLECNEIIDNAERIPAINKVVLSNNMPYTGKAQKPTVTVYDIDGHIIDSVYYTVNTPKSVNIGTYTATIKFNGKYDGTLSAEYQITPKSTKLTKLILIPSSVEVQWKAQKDPIDGYLIQYSTNKNFSDYTQIFVNNKTTTSKKIKNLSIKKYYFRIAAYKNVTTNGKKVNILSSWSKVSNAKIVKKNSLRIVPQPEKTYVVGYSSKVYQHAYDNKIEIYIQNDNPDKKLNSVILYRSNTKNGKYKKIKQIKRSYKWSHEDYCDSSFHFPDCKYKNYDHYYFYADKKVKSNTKYYYKVEGVYNGDVKVINNTSSTAVSMRTAPKNSQKVKETSGTVLNFTKAKKVSGYMIWEESFEFEGYNIFGQRVYGISEVSYLSNQKSVYYSKIKNESYCEKNSLLDYSAIPYVKEKGYYYCDGYEIKKKLPVSNYIDYEKRV